MNTLIINIVLSTVIFYLAYRWLLKPHLHALSPVLVLTPLLLLHSLRHLGLMFLTTGVTSPDLPQAFAIPAATGDFVSASLALLALVLIQNRSRWALGATWAFSIVGSLDFISAIVLSRVYRAGDFLGGAYWIPAFWVPLLIVAHAIIFKVLWRMKQEGRSFE